MALPMTDTPERELIERLAVAIREEQVRQHRDDERGKCPAGAAFYEEHVGPYQIATVVMRELEALLSRVDKLEERVRELEDEIVDLWHESEAGRKELHECLGMTAEEYARWANPDALNKNAS